MRLSKSRSFLSGLFILSLVTASLVAASELARAQTPEIAAPDPERLILIAPSDDADDYGVVDYALDVAGLGLQSPLLSDDPGGGSGGSGCWLGTRNPHDAKHDPGKVAAVGYIRCPQYDRPSYMYVHTWLYKRVDGDWVLKAHGTSDSQYGPEKHQWWVSKRVLANCPGDGRATYGVQATGFVQWPDAPTSSGASPLRVNSVEC